MKKILALTLAAVMTAGMTTVAFAAPDGVTHDINNGHAAYEANDDVDQVIVPSVEDRFGKYLINEDGEVDTSADDLSKVTDPLEGGDQIAIPVFLYEYWTSDNGSYYDYEHSVAIEYTKENIFGFDESIDVWTDWEETSADVKPRFVKYNDNGKNERRIMSIVVTVPDNDSDVIENLMGTLKVGTSSTRARRADDSTKLDIEYAPDGTKEYYKDNFDGDEVLEAGETGIVDFDTEAGEIDIEFGEQALFTVNVTGQGRLNLSWNTRHDPEVAALDESVNMDFITFSGNPSFNRTGTMYIYAADDTFLYQVVDGKLEKVDATYNEDYEAWEFRTRTLGEYVIADGEIDLEAITETEDNTSSSTTDDGKVNPDTGR